ncbi:MAG: LacI family DNA-binding transcriptional regulator [Chloroflexi bacterium]|nr:LacI family DNA-binding transcriptional regulator [Chloroflexota bacterium]
MARKSVSLHDIAAAAGVSHSTVSRALRDSRLISVEVRRRIQGLATDMGYVPNAVAQSLQGSRTRAVGVLVTTISDPFFADVVAGMESVARPAGYSLLLVATHNDPRQEREGVADFRRRRVDGLIMASSRGLPAPDAAPNLPLVLVNSQSARIGAGMHSVAVDDRRGLAAQLFARGATALFCYNDMIAIGALRACRDLALRVPHDVSVVGFDDVAPSRYCEPELTTMHQPSRLLGEVAMQLLLDLLEGRPVHDRVLMPQLIVRESTTHVFIAHSSRRNTKI